VGLELYDENLQAAMTEAHPDQAGYIADMFTSWLGADVSARDIPKFCFGPGLALMPNGDLLHPTNPVFANFSEGYITLAENNHPDMGALPVALHVIKVKKEKYRGAVKVIASDNVLDEKISMRHTADFGANPEHIQFQWLWREDDGTRLAPDPAKWDPFKPLDESVGLSEISLSGAGPRLLTDNWFFVRYRYCDLENNVCDTEWSEWAGAANSRPPEPGEDPALTYQAQLADGWIKRVVNGINPFEARIRNFSTTDNPATYVSMIQQAGPGYEGDVAFNPSKDVIENVGLIELYSTVLERGKELSIDLEGTVESSGVFSALMLAAGRIAGFYALLGNEAYADALDPTVGVGSDSTMYGSLAPTIYAFMNQVPGLLDEELALLRGRPEAGARPAYNRLLWNFTKDQGEAAYALSYNISDVTKDGFIDEADGRTLYPQGHGDAWGHYLSALSGYYDLLTHPEFNWQPRPESFSIEGVVFNVDYLDERRFAEAAAAKAKTGSEIVNLTYRAKYVEDPDGQWQGYKDTDADRAWGVSGWSRRAFQGALFDWAAGNFLLPSEADAGNTGLDKIDRTTVDELLEVAAQARQIRQHFDNANTGVNPLGLVADAVPFDIDPSRVLPGASNSATHFEQVAERAEKAMDNARAIFDHASDLKNRIRQTADSAGEFSEQVGEQDRDYRNRLIETFGTPYEGTVGAGKVYPAGYRGPDYYLYMYVDVNDVSKETVPPPSDSFKAYYKPLNEQYDYFFDTDLPESGFTSTDFSEEMTVDFPMSAGKYSFQAPEGWGMRKSPGEIQQTLIELVKAEAEHKLALADYSELLSTIRIKMDLLKARMGLKTETTEIKDERDERTERLDYVILACQKASELLDAAAEKAKEAADAAAEAPPKVAGMATDVTSVARSAVKLAGVATSGNLKALSYAAKIGGFIAEARKEAIIEEAESAIAKAEYNYAVQQMLKDIETELGKEAAKRLEIFRRQENMRQVSEKYRAVLQKGLRLMEERKAFNARVAAKTQGKRYQDMAFRLNMNDALSKYRQAFDLAARYVYLAAKAYDYETNLSHSDPGSAIPLLTDIVRQRTLGQYEAGRWVVGRGGLGDVLARLGANFDIYKGQMGFNNPQTETGRLSLRYELFRQPKAESLDTDAEKAVADAAWEKALEEKKVADLWDVPEFRKGP
jgi:hypothetical protein